VVSCQNLFQYYVSDFFQYYIYFPKIANDNLQKIGAAAGAVQKPLYISPSAGYKTGMF